MFDLKKFRKDNKLTQKELALLFNCTNSNISMAESSMKNPEEHQLKILLETFGEKVNDYFIDEEQCKNKVSDDFNLIPLVPISAMAGKLTGFSLEGITQSDCEKVISPIKGVDFAVPVSGDSMYPLFPNGSRVLVQETNPNSFIEWGKVYVLNTCNGIVIKQVRKSNKEGYVSCYSFNDNSIYAPFDIALADIHGFYKVLMCLSMQ